MRRMMFICLNCRPHWLHFSKHHNQYGSWQIYLNLLTLTVSADAVRLILNCKEKKKRSQAYTGTFCQLCRITDRTDNGSWVQCGRAECAVWPSTQMSMFHFGESRERDRRTQRDGGEKWNLDVFVNHKEIAAWACRGERERRWDGRWQRRETERQAACVFMLCRD